jgi:glycosyltransferase involved in cell wall biosynthesis
MNHPNVELFDNNNSKQETMDAPKYNPAYLTTLQKQKDEGTHFPFRYLCDENNNILPIVLVAAFFRSDVERNMYDEYIENGIKVVGITAYKTFPKPITDKSGDSDTVNDPFDYYGNIQNWLSCFKYPADYGFTSWNQLENISESDFYDAEPQITKEKKYDFIYVCLKDDETCPMDGWNAINRNFKLALNCFPIIMNEMGLNMLVIGRVNCGLEKLYGDRITIMDFLPHAEFQEKLRESRFLFVPNIYDASPRIISEAIIKGVPVLLNKNIVCGSKYIHSETGQTFTDENDLRYSIEKLITKSETMNPRLWWLNNYSKQKSGEHLKDILSHWYPDLGIWINVKGVYFY